MRNAMPTMSVVLLALSLVAGCGDKAGTPTNVARPSQQTDAARSAANYNVFHDPAVRDALKDDPQYSQKIENTALPGFKVATAPTPAETPAQPATEKPAEGAAEKPAETPTATQPAATQPAATQPAAETPATEKPAEGAAEKPAETPAAEKPAEPAATQPAATQPAAETPATEKPAENP